MPTAAAAVGQIMTFRTLSAHAHILTGSQETAGTTAFRNTAGTVGSRLTLGASVGDGVVLHSDGRNIWVIGGSGSFAGT